MEIETIDYHPRQYGKSVYGMEVALANVRLGKKVLFAFIDLNRGISILHYHFPKALYEVVGDRGLIVWQRKLK